MAAGLVAAFLRAPQPEQSRVIGLRQLERLSAAETSPANGTLGEGGAKLAKEKNRRALQAWAEDSAGPPV
jgi:hypothetical protein